MMRNLSGKEVQPGTVNRLLMLIFFALAVLVIEGCGSGDGGGKNITTQSLPTGFSLGLECDDVGVYPEDCVLDDRRNPYATINIIEFDPEDEDADNKFDLFDEIPPGPDYAISRFYFWATALARRGSGENQFYTAVALQELWSAGVDDGFGSPNAQEQAKKAYRACLDYFFEDFTYIGPFPADSDDFIPLVIRGLVGTQLVAPDTAPDKFNTLFPGDDTVLNAKVELGDWGYFYVPAGPCGEEEDPDCINQIPADIIRNNNLPIPPQLD
jgi:hypothetical protein